MDNFLGYAVSALIGVSLGLIGGGGSIIAVPMLVYLFHIEPVFATAYSLVIVGSTSLVGSIRSSLNKMVNFKTAFLFSIPSLVAVYLTRHFLLPNIPSIIFSARAFILTKDTLLMIFFSVLMIIASLKMIMSKTVEVQDGSEIQLDYLKMSIQAIILGIITGIIGAGGGFLIIPTLVLFAGLGMKKAIGTSLVIITINSLSGFLGDIGTGIQLNYPLVAIISGFAIAGVFIGTYISKFIDGSSLKKGFGWFALAMALVILSKEILC
jgi:uncharacterized membrane protein YfcA